MFNFFHKSSDPAVTPGSVSDLPVPGGPSPDRTRPSSSFYKPTEPATPFTPAPALSDPITHTDDQKAEQTEVNDAIAAEDGTSRNVQESDIPNSASTTQGPDVTRQPTVAVVTHPPKQEDAAAMAPKIPGPTDTYATERTAPAPTAIDFEDSQNIVYPGQDDDETPASAAAPSTINTQQAPVPADVTRHQLSDPPVQQEPKPILRSSSPTPGTTAAAVGAGAIAASEYSPTRRSYSRDPSMHNRRASRGSSPAPPSVTSGAATRRARSMRSIRSVNTNGEPINGSTFVDGAATAAPLGGDPALHERVATANQELSTKEKAKLQKAECEHPSYHTSSSACCLIIAHVLRVRAAAKHGRKMSVIIKQEAKAEQQALEVATKELAEVQKLQKVAIKVRHSLHSSSSHC